ncbi:MAG: glycosyltransferase, partial [Steroidobacteraceae bacterium]
MRDPEISVVIPVCLRHDDVTALYLEYKTGVARVTPACEFIFVLDGPHPEVLQALRHLTARGERITIIETTRAFGEATALTIGFEHVRGNVVMTLPAYFQIQAGEIQRLVRALDGADLVIGHRWPRAGSWFESLRRAIFHNILGWVTHLHFHDLGCCARAMTRAVVAELQLYGDQHRFLPVLADRRGFRVRELDVQQSARDACARAYAPREYARGLLDIFTVFFLVRFTKKPLRFFGTLGASLFAVGGLLLLYLLVQRVWFDQGLADRPALLLASLVVVFGLQLFALGLLGELIIFTHARDVKDYAVDRVIQYPAPG